jgi:hypothetical protein
LSSNCRQLHTQILCIKGNLIQRSASLFDTPTCCAGGFVQEARERMTGRQQTGSMQDPANGLRRTPLLGNSVNKDRKRAGDREVPSPLPLLDRPYGFCPGGALPAGFWFSSTCVRFTF